MEARSRLPGPPGTGRPDATAPWSTAPRPSGGRAPGRARPPRRPRGPPPGFSLLQIVLLLALVALAAGVLLPLSSQILSLERSSRTERQMRELKRAILGPQEIGDLRERSAYGYLGDMGNLPDSLPQLARRLSQPAFTVAAARRLGAGWRGPYGRLRTLEDTVEVFRDAFRRRLRYVTADSTAGGETWDAFLQSGGEDRDLSTADDNVVVPILVAEVRGEVRGVVVDPDGNPAVDAPVALTHRRNGSLVDTTAFADGAGSFRFVDVPFGPALVRLGVGGGGGPGELEYVPGTAVYEAGADQEVEFGVRNTGETPIEVTSWTATYDRTAYYRRIKIATPDDAGEGKTVFDAGPGGGGPPGGGGGGTWPGSGDLVNFDQPDTIPPPAATSAVSEHLLTFAVDGPEVSVDTLRQETAGGDGTTVIRIEEFHANSNGTGPPVDMSGASFTIDFSDGSTVSFTVP